MIDTFWIKFDDFLILNDYVGFTFDFSENGFLINSWLFWNTINFFWITDEKIVASFCITILPLASSYSIFLLQTTFQSFEALLSSYAFFKELFLYYTLSLRLLKKRIGKVIIA